MRRARRGSSEPSMRPPRLRYVDVWWVVDGLMRGRSVHRGFTLVKTTTIGGPMLVTGEEVAIKRQPYYEGQTQAQVRGRCCSDSVVILLSLAAPASSTFHSALVRRWAR